MAGAMSEPDHRICSNGDVDQLGVSDELQVAAGTRRHHDSPLVKELRQFRDRPADTLLGGPVTVGLEQGKFVIDGPGEISCDSRDHLGQLNRLGDVVNEVNEDAQIDQQQRFGNRDREMRDEIAGDRSEREDGVDEGAHKDPQRQLVSPVSDEVPHHPGSELLRCEGERQDGDGEHHPDDGDHRSRYCDEDLTTGISASGADPKGKSQLAMVGRQVDAKGHQEEKGGHHDQNGWHQPKGGTERFPTPAGKFGPPVAIGSVRHLRKTGFAHGRS
jgi:hypothetical protein